MIERKMSYAPCVLIVSDECPVCKVLMLVNTFSYFVEWLQRTGCSILFPQDLWKFPEYVSWARKCGVVCYKLVGFDVEEVVKTPAVITPIGCVEFKVPTMPIEKLIPFLRTAEAWEFRTRLKYQIERARTLVKIACRMYGWRLREEQSRKK